MKLYLFIYIFIIGKVVLKHSDDKVNSINKRQLRKLLEYLSIELKESEENSLFENLDFKGLFIVIIKF